MLHPVMEATWEPDVGQIMFLEDGDDDDDDDDTSGSTHPKTLTRWQETRRV